MYFRMSGVLFFPTYTDDGEQSSLAEAIHSAELAEATHSSELAEATHNAELNFLDTG